MKRSCFVTALSIQCHAEKQEKTQKNSVFKGNAKTFSIVFYESFILKN